MTFSVLLHICHIFLAHLNFRANEGIHFIWNKTLGMESVDHLPQRDFFQIRISDGFTFEPEFKLVKFPVTNCNNTEDVECPLKQSAGLLLPFWDVVEFSHCNVHYNLREQEALSKDQHMK